jgi:hypothetical protein
LSMPKPAAFLRRLSLNLQTWESRIEPTNTVPALSAQIGSRAQARCLPEPLKECGPSLR